MFAKLASQNVSRLYLAQCLLFLAALSVFFSCMSPYFFSLGNISNVLTASAVIGFIAIGATFVIGSGGIDLSSAAVMALCGTVCAWGLQKGEWSPWLAIPFSIGLGGFFGLMTGFLINVTKAPSFIVSLGMMSIARAAAYIVSKGMPIYGLPDNLINAGQGNVSGLPVTVLLLIVGIAFAWVIITKTQFGLHTLIFGDNIFAAEAMGVPTNKLRLKIFSLAGAYSGAAGIIFMLRTNAGDPSAGQSYELMGITAVILGGANLFGGRATIIGTILGVLCLGVLQNGLNLLAVSTYYQILFVGLVLLGAAFLSRMGYRR
jgi:ribose transport system permease protein